MKQRFTALSSFAALLVVASLAAAAFAQEQSTQKPMFKHPLRTSIRMQYQPQH